MKKLFRKGERVMSRDGLVMEVCGYPTPGKVEVSWFDIIRREVYHRVLSQKQLQRAF